MPLDSSPMDDQKNKALAAALAQIEKQFGKGSIMKMGDAQIQNDLQVVSTGSLGLDIALGVGGLPRGRVVEIYGPESSGKTTLSLQVVAQVQKAGGTAAYIDAENALDPVYAGKLGVNVGDLLISQPDTGEQALEIADMLVRSGGVDIIVIDSVAALVPKAEIEGEMGDQLPGLQARLMSQALRKLTANIKRANTLVIFINQIRMKIGVMFGNPETTTGGNALKFYASVRLDIRRIGAIKKGEEVDRQRDARQGGEEQGRAAVPRGALRHPLRRGHLAPRRDHRARRRARHRRQVGRVVRVQRREDRPGQGQHARVPARASRDRRGDRGEDPRRGRRSGARRAARTRRAAARGIAPYGACAAVASLVPRGPPKSLKARAIGALARREYSRAELRANSLVARAAPEDAETVLDELAALGYLSDARFAQAVVSRRAGIVRVGVRSRARSRPRASRRTIAGAALAMADADDRDSDGRAVAAPVRLRPGQRREKARQVRFLQSRGFALSAIFRLLREPPAD